MFLAERAYDVHLLNLTNAGLSISGKNVLAFSSSLDWNIERVKGGSMVAGRAVQHEVARHRLGGADLRRTAGGPECRRGADLRRHQRGGGVVGEPADAAEDELQGRGADRSRFRRGASGVVLRAGLRHRPAFRGIPSRRDWSAHSSSNTVTGPSLTSWTCMSAPKTPVSTWAPRARSASAKAVTSGSATAPGAAAFHVGRLPLAVLA